MKDFAARLVARAFGAGTTIRPRVLPLFAPRDAPAAPAGFLEETVFQDEPASLEVARKPRVASNTGRRPPAEAASRPAAAAVDSQPPQPRPDIPADAAPETERSSIAFRRRDNHVADAAGAADMPAAPERVPERARAKPAAVPDDADSSRDFTAAPAMTARALAVAPRPNAGSERTPPKRDIVAASVPPPRHGLSRPDPSPDDGKKNSPERPLESPVRSLRATDPARAVAAPGPSENAPAREPPSVVVEIGSIEFRAPPAAAQPKQTGRPRPTLALADYLARRR